MSKIVAHFVRGAFGAALLLGAGAANAQMATTKDQLLGSWKVTVFMQDVGGTVSYPYGQAPAGNLTFTPDGRAMVLIVDSARKAPASAAATDAEAGQLLRTHLAWGAKVDLDAAPTADGTKATFHLDVSSNQISTGSDRVFFLKVEGNKLTAKSISQPSIQTGQVAVGTLVFEKVM